MNATISTINNDRGSTVVLVMIVLVMLTILGLSSISTSSIEVQISANDKFYKRTFYTSESGGVDKWAAIITSGSLPGSSYPLTISVFSSLASLV